ncbi:MAG: rod shape-determining protein MreD [Nocardioides sp.]
MTAAARAVASEPIGAVSGRAEVAVAPIETRPDRLAFMPIRVALAVGLALLALTAQVSLAPELGAIGILPNFVLLIVIAAAVARGSDVAATLGFVLGVALDLGPASDHLAGRWALALVVVGYVVGSINQGRLGRNPHRLLLGGIAGTASFICSSLFALTGLALGELHVAVGIVLHMVLVGSLTDAALGLVLLPYPVTVFARLKVPREGS